MTQHYCDVHGPVMKTSDVKGPEGIAVTWTWTLVCPICHRELFSDEPLTEIERQGKHKGKSEAQ